MLNIVWDLIEKQGKNRVLWVGDLHDLYCGEAQVTVDLSWNKQCADFAKHFTTLLYCREAHVQMCFDLNWESGDVLGNDLQNLERFQGLKIVEISTEEALYNGTLIPCRLGRIHLDRVCYFPKTYLLLSCCLNCPKIKLKWACSLNIISICRNNLNSLIKKISHRIFIRTGKIVYHWSLYL